MWENSMYKKYYRWLKVEYALVGPIKNNKLLTRGKSLLDFRITMSLYSMKTKQKL